jgi:hypothetical protein
MQPAQVHCPECGAPAPFRGTAVSLVCEYCGSTVVRMGAEVRLLGKVSALLDNGSPILLGSAGRFDGVPFEVTGRLQLRYRRGTWNEWFISFADGTGGWLSDAQGGYSVVLPKPRNIIAGKLPGFAGFVLGQPIVVQGVHYVPVERRAASYQGEEGALPFVAEPGLVFQSVDLRGHDGEFMTLDYGTTDEPEDPPALYIGRAVDLAELGLQPLRKFAGWPERAGGPRK